MKERRKPECLQRVKVKKLTMQRNGKEEAAQGVVTNTTANNDRRPELQQTQTLPLAPLPHNPDQTHFQAVACLRKPPRSKVHGTLGLSTAETSPSLQHYLYQQVFLSPLSQALR